MARLCTYRWWWLVPYTVPLPTMGVTGFFDEAELVLNEIASNLSFALKYEQDGQRRQAEMAVKRHTAMLEEHVPKSNNHQPHYNAVKFITTGSRNSRGRLDYQ